MIKLQRLTPYVYNNESRDFQFLAKLFDVVLNSAKTNAELINGIPLSENIDDDLLDLAALTLGLKSMHSYNTAQLKSICSTFSYILRNKGTTRGIKMACDALLQAEGLSQESKVYVEDYVVYINVPAELSDISLLKDILSYILPAGISCNIIKATRVSEGAKTQLAFTGTVTSYEKATGITSIPKADEIRIGKTAYPKQTDAADNEGYIMNTEILA